MGQVLDSEDMLCATQELLHLHVNPLTSVADDPPAPTAEAKSSLTGETPAT